MIKINTLYSLENISDCYYIKEDCQVYNINGYKKTQTLGKRGYYYVSLNEKYSNRQVKVPLHKIVALAFIKNAPYEVINHIDGNKQNNNINNLEFCTQRDNLIHAWRNGLVHRRERIFDIQFSNDSHLIGSMKTLSIKSNIPKGTLYDLFYKKKGTQKYNIVKITEVILNKGLETIEPVNHAKGDIERSRVG